MKQSGTKLVLGLACLALVAGLASWSYRYGATHEATQFWGSEAAMLIARPSHAEFFRLELADAAEDSADVLDLGRPYLATLVREVTNERGMVHFRHALMSDGNYVWASQPEPREVDWRWGLRFEEGNGRAWVVMSEDLATIGLVVEGGSPPVRAAGCQPMAETLRDYFGRIELTTASTGQ